MKKLPLNPFPRPLQIILTITITKEFKLKQNGCLPLNSGKHPFWNLNIQFSTAVQKIHINGRMSIWGLLSILLQLCRQNRYAAGSPSADASAPLSSPAVESSAAGACQLLFETLPVHEAL